MPSTSRQLDHRGGLIWVNTFVVTPHRQLKLIPMVLDSGSAHTIIEAADARKLGYTEDRKDEDATWDTPDGPISGYMLPVVSFTALGRELKGYRVGCKSLSGSLDVRGILGMDFFEGTDLTIAFRRRLLNLDW